jgi:hypothetical protein
MGNWRGSKTGSFLHAKPVTYNPAHNAAAASVTRRRRERLMWNTVMQSAPLSSHRRRNPGSLWMRSSRDTRQAAHEVSTGGPLRRSAPLLA